MCRPFISGSDYRPKKLIMAVADFAEDDQNPLPPELDLAWKVERWGVGAVFPDSNIPLRLSRRMNAALNVFNAFKSMQLGASRLADWARSNPHFSKIIHTIRTMREE